jgi:hypothetical protein
MLQTNIVTSVTVETVRKATIEKIETHPECKADLTNTSVRLSTKITSGLIE